METSIIIDRGVTYTRVAVCEEGTLVDLFLENKNHRQIQGSIYQGTVSNVLKGIKAAFLEIGVPKKAFLHYKDIPEELKGRLQNNQRMMVQVVKDGVGDKGPKVTGFINIVGQYMVLLPLEKTIGISRKIIQEEQRERLRDIIVANNPEGYGVIVRTGAANIPTETLGEELEILIRSWEQVKLKGVGAAGGTVLYEEPSLPIKVIREYANRNIKEIVINHEGESKLIMGSLSKDLKDKLRVVDQTTNLYGAYNIDKEIERALRKQVWLKSGANIIIEKTEAMNIIDVNSAKLTTLKQKDKTILKANLQAAKESAKQIRLRNLSGIIIIDFIDMADVKDQEEVVRILQLELSKDKVKTRVYPMTELGLVQVTRQRKSLSLGEEITHPCPCCHSSYRTLSYDYMMVGIEKEIRDIVRESIHRKVQIQGGIELVGYIENKTETKNVLESKYGIEISLVKDQKLEHTQYEVKVWS